MSVHPSVMNNIIAKYRFSIRRLDDVFDELHGFRMFFKIDIMSCNSQKLSLANYFSQFLN